jgi:hypothetical protein
MPAATTYTITATPNPVVVSGNTTITVTPNGTFTGTITLSDGASPGTFSSGTLNFTDASPQTTTYTAQSTPGNTSISGVASPTLTDPAATTLVVGAAATSALPTINLPDVIPSAPVTVTVTVNGIYSGVVTLSDGGNGGSFNPPTLTFTSQSGTKTSIYTAPPTAQNIVIAVSTSPTLSNGTIPLTVHYVQPPKGLDVRTVKAGVVANTVKAEDVRQRTEDAVWARQSGTPSSGTV